MISHISSQEEWMEGSHCTATNKGLIALKIFRELQGHCVLHLIPCNLPCIFLPLKFGSEMRKIDKKIWKQFVNTCLSFYTLWIMEEDRKEEYDDKIVLFSNACTEILFFMSCVLLIKSIAVYRSIWLFT